MKKKILAMVLSLAMCCSMTACGSANKDTATSDGASSDKKAASKNDNGSDLSYIQDKGTLIVGITDFEPMDYQKGSDEWIGFDADMANAFAKSLGVKAEFVEIDCVWNGMTLTDEVTSSMACTNAYCNNAQVAIVKAADKDKYSTVESMKDLNFAVEAGSAGEKELSKLGYNYTSVKAQADALMEVSAGTSDAAVIDSLMAAAMVGEGTGYEKLTYTASFNSEEYGVGFRKGSDMADKLNDFFAESYKDGSMKKTAEKYGVQAAVMLHLRQLLPCKERNNKRQV